MVGLRLYEYRNVITYTYHFPFELQGIFDVRTNGG
jgi:hypothetical protein